MILTVRSQTLAAQIRSNNMSVLVTDLRPHLALVTGASGGIGRATCRSLASMGCSIAVHYHSSAGPAKELVDELRINGVKAEVFKADLTNYDQVRRAVS
jgi:3-oxoacyl-[acyl-carrier protein] reductase